jgi:hypothetical protein
VKVVLSVVRTLIADRRAVEPVFKIQLAGCREKLPAAVTTPVVVGHTRC